MNKFFFTMIHHMDLSLSPLKSYTQKQQMKIRYFSTFDLFFRDQHDPVIF
jgi:hypothetical protein